MTTRIRGYGLDNLIRHITPTFDGWNTDPTDVANITDGDTSTICTTGSKTLSGGWQKAHIIYDWGVEHKVLLGGLGGCTTSAGTWYIQGTLYVNGAWNDIKESFASSTSNTANLPFTACASVASAVKLSITASVAATLTPRINEFYVWKVA